MNSRQIAAVVVTFVVVMAIGLFVFARVFDSVGLAIAPALILAAALSVSTHLLLRPRR